MTRRPLLSILLAFSAGWTGAAGATDPAYFWISESGSAPSGPEAPTISLTEGDSDTLYIWARPITDKKLRNFSLNLVADASGVDFDDSGYTVHSNIAGSVDRFEYVLDSSTTPALESEESNADVALGMVDSLIGIQGFTLVSSSDIRGVGPGCLSADSNCYEATDGLPAWLIAEIDINATTAGTVNLNLQIGDLGMNHETVPSGDYNFDGIVDSEDFDQWRDDYGSTTYLVADGNGDGVVNAADYAVWRNNLGATGSVESAASTEVVFGIDTSDGVDEPEHNAATDRSTNLAMDDPDAVIMISAPPGSGASAPTPEPQSLLLLLGASAGGLLRRAWTTRDRC